MDVLPQVTPEFNTIPFYIWDTDEAIVDTIINSAKNQMIHGHTYQEL